MFEQRSFYRPHAYAALALLLLFAGCDLSNGENDEPLDDGLVLAVEKAPVAPDGNVAGRITDLVLHLNVSMDPAEPGLALHTGDEIRVTLPEAFTRVSELPILDIFACLGQHLQCDTAVLLVGWPQGALGAPPPIGYEVRYDGSHTIVLTATADHLPDPPAHPGLKQIHLLLNNFENPPAGLYEIGVAVETSAGVARGIGEVRILPEMQPGIAVTNAFHEGFANGNYQETAPGAVLGFPFDFLLWDGGGHPLEGVTIDGNRLMQGGDVIGQVTTGAPAGATGHAVFTEAASTRINAPVTGVPAGHLRAFFRAGSVPGEYVTTFALEGGNAVQMVVRVR